MKHTYLVLAMMMAIGLMRTSAQNVVPVGSGSYASFPPAAQNTADTTLYPFVFNRHIYVSPDNTRPIPTNDWWTDLLFNGKNAGSLWVSPLVVHPENTGVRMYFPNSFVSTGDNMNQGGSMHISSAGYSPTQAFARNWFDWGLVMSMPDSTDSANMDVTMTQGIPFVWYEINGMNPAFSFDQGSTYLNADGSPVQFPISGPFVIQTDGRYFGVHTDGKSTATIQGQQFAMIDLGSPQSMSLIKLYWENAYGKAYTVQVSNDTVNWTTIYSQSNGQGGLDSFPVTGSGRYVKLNLLEKGTNFGYSLFEMQVFRADTLLSQNQPVEVSSTQQPWVAAGLNDGNFGTRWGSDLNAAPQLVLNTGKANTFFVISALNSPADLTTFDQYAYNKPTNTQVSYSYNSGTGKVNVNWNITTVNLKGGAAGNTLQGFLPHLYADAANNISFTNYSYTTSHGQLKTAIGNSFAFTYDFNGIIPNYTAPYRNDSDAHPYDAKLMFDLLTKVSANNNYGTDTYFGGKDLVNFAKYTLIAKELNHQAYGAMKAKTREALVNWLTYTPGEPSKYFARYDRWGAMVGFNQSFGSAQFTDNHFHYGYLVLACALYGTVDPDFITQYGPMIKQVVKQYANWDRSDSTFPWFRTFNPWIGHSYAGGESSGSGNNQESSSEAMQSWIGMFLLGDLLNDQSIRDAAAFGYSSESYSVMEYWFDWKKRNHSPSFPYKMAAIVSDQGYGHVTFFGGRPIYIHGIEYLPVNPGFKYLVRDTAWASREYKDLMSETLAKEGFNSETSFGIDWANVALGFHQMFDPAYVAAFLDKNRQLGDTSSNYVLKDVTGAMTYYYTHADQNLGTPSFNYRTDFPTSSVFERNGAFAHAVAYNPSTSDKTCNVFNAAGAQIGSFTVPARTLITWPNLPTTGSAPSGCYGLLPASATASSGNASLAVDGNMGSRWESAFSDPQQLTVDLGLKSTVNTITIFWENASAQNYNILASTDSVNWDTLAIKTNMPAGPNRIDTIPNINKSYRWLKMDGRTRTTPYGYSIFEFQVCGTADSTSAPATTSVVLPAFIKASNFTDSLNVQTESTSDFGGGKDVGYIQTGSYMDYKVNSPVARTYEVRLRISSPLTTGAMQILSNNVLVDTVSIPNTGCWQCWATIATNVPLPAGDQTLRILAANTGYNVNFLDIRIAGATKHIEAENYTQMSGGVKTEPVQDIDGGLDVGWINTGAWMDYSVNIPQAGDYKLSYRIASPNATGQLQFKIGDTVLATTNIPNTGGWQNWSTVTTTVHFNTAGTQTIQLYVSGGGFNINWLELENDNVTFAASSAKTVTANSAAQFTNTDKARQPVLYPNPARGQVYIIADKASQFAVTDVQGKVIKTGIVQPGTNTIDITGFAPGIYLIRLSDRTFKLVVNAH